MTDPGAKHWREINSLCGRMAKDGGLALDDLYRLEDLIREVRKARGRPGEMPEERKTNWTAADMLSDNVDHFLKHAELLVIVGTPLIDLIKELKSAWGQYELAKAQREMMKAGEMMIAGTKERVIHVGIDISVGQHAEAIHAWRLTYHHVADTSGGHTGNGIQTTQIFRSYTCSLAEVVARWYEKHPMEVMVLEKYEYLGECAPL